MHIPNNMDYTVTPDNGQFVLASNGGGCTLISANDPQIAAYRASPARRRGQPDPTSTQCTGLRLNMPSWSELEPFIVSGLALGGVYALSGVGLVVLYRATGVLYLAFGAVGAMGALPRLVDDQQAAAPGWVGLDRLHPFRRRGRRSVYGQIFGPAWPRETRWSMPWPRSA